MSGILTPGERTTRWGVTGDLARRVSILEATPSDCCVPDNPGTLSDLILANPCLSAFWKLNDSSGTTAVDSSGNGLDLTSSGLVVPTWGSTAIVASDDSAAFTAQPGAPPQGLSRASFPDLDTASFTAMIFLRRTGLSFDPMLGQGPITGEFNTAAWGLGIQAFNQGAGNRPYLFSASAGVQIISSAAITSSASTHMVAVTYELSSTTWTLYQDGASEGTDTGALTGQAGIWLGADDDSSTTEQFDGDLAYGAVFTCALTPDQIAEMWTLFENPDAIPNGWVLTADSTTAEGWSWQPSTVEVEF